MMKNGHFRTSKKCVDFYFPQFCKSVKCHLRTTSRSEIIVVGRGLFTGLENSRSGLFHLNIFREISAILSQTCLRGGKGKKWGF